MKLNGKIALVTGGGSGIGKAISQAYAEAGAMVLVADINPETGNASVKEIEAAGGKAKFVQLDVTSPDSVAAAAAAVTADPGRLDILCNAAGWDIIEPFVNNTPEYWDKIVQINFMGPVRLTRAMLDLLMASEHNKIVNIASDAGRVGSMGETVYAGAKGGVIAFTKSLAREMARYKVNVNCVCPGPTDTPLFATQPEKMREALAKAIPLRRVAKPSEIADAALFFASSRSDFCTGQVLSVSGGLTMVD
ncbi:MAG: glucose 1-dehydrogenase [Rhodobiaceae bacterium]|nr:glucose 1-dehydrogenase [Rhodobiaceae bacterium]MCC0054731.1 glucose 1-dehydrogenase [Rhodobiaceae bacterium]